MRISEVRATICDIPLSAPIVIGDITYATRDYLLVEIRTDEGLTGIGFGMARYAPLAEIVDRNLAPLLLGEDPLLIERLWEKLYYGNFIIGQRGILMRALSAIDIALWDLKGKIAGLPVWQLLGGSRWRIPTLVAGGYPRLGVSLKDLEAELERYVRSGARMVKIAGGELASDTERLRVARRAAGPGTKLMYDAHWTWRDLSEVLSVVQRWEDLELAWIEDPFPTELTSLTTRFRSRSRIPLAIGEDLVGRWAYDRLLRSQGADVVRVDATTVGGLSEAVRVCTLASTEGLPVSPHIFPELHVHLAAAFPHVIAVEVTDPAQEIDLFHRLLEQPLLVERGEVVAPTAPGLGVELDRAAIERYACKVTARS